MSTNPRVYFPLLAERENYLRQLDYCNIYHPYYIELHEEYRFLIDDLFKIMQNNKTISQYEIVLVKLTELRKYLEMELSNKDGGGSENDFIKTKSENDEIKPPSKSNDESIDELLSSLKSLMKS